MCNAVPSAIPIEMNNTNQKTATPPEEEEVNWPVVIGIIATMIIIVLILNFA